MKAYGSFVDCAICAGLPDRIEVRDAPLPAASEKLEVVVEVAHDRPDYESATTRLLKCPACGGYFHSYHYSEEAHYPHNYGASDDRALRRYDPATAADFLERIVAAQPGTLPAPTPQLTRAFAEGAGAPEVRLADPAGPQAAARAELAELASRKAEIDGVLRNALLASRDAHRSCAVRGLCFGFAAADDWPGLAGALLGHANASVRVETAILVIDVGTQNASVVDLMHMPRRLWDWFSGVLKGKDRRAELVAVLTAAATDPGSENARVRRAALDGLDTAAYYRLNLRPAIAPLVGLLDGEASLRDAVCRTLGRIAEKNRSRARTILQLLESHAPWTDARVQELMEQSAQWTLR